MRAFLSLPLRAEHVFLLLGAAFGVAFLLLTPPFQVPDEFVHYYRAYQVSEGRLFPEARDGVAGAMLPKAIADAARTFEPIPFHPERKVTLREIRAADLPIDPSQRTFLPVAAYSPVCYTPQVAGILLARLLGFGAVSVLYAGRLFALLFWLAAVFLAVRIAPAGKRAFVAVSLLPMTLFLAPSLSADSFTYAIVALDVAIAMRVAVRPGPLSGTDIAWVIALSIVTACLKLPYSMLFLVFLLIPAWKLRGRRDLALALAGTLALCLLIVMMWTLVQSGNTPKDIRVSDTIVASPSGQLSMIARNPKLLLRAIVKTYAASRAVGIAGEIAGKLGWVDVILPRGVRLAAWLSLLWSFALVGSELSKLKPLWAYRIVIVAVLLGAAALITLVIYMAYNPVGWRTQIVGIQGRYFIPLLLPLVPLLAMRKRLVLPEVRWETWVLAAIQAGVLLFAARELLVRYFGA